MQDGVNSVVRYVKNNFLDGPRQDSYDLVTGAWIPRKGQDQAWGDDRLFLTRMVSSLFSAFRGVADTVIRHRSFLLLDCLCSSSECSLRKSFLVSARELLRGDELIVVAPQNTC